MKTRFRILALALLGLPVAFTSGTQALAQSDDDQAIRAVLREYVEGWGTADYERLARVLDPAGHVYWLGGDGPDQHLQSMTFAQIMARDPRPQPEYGREWNIESLDIIDRHVAAARVSISRAGGSYLDVLVLHRIAGNWRIVTKTFSTRAQ